MRDNFQRETHHPVEIPRANVAKYLGLHLDSKLTWKVHIAKRKSRWI